MCRTFQCTLSELLDGRMTTAEFDLHWAEFQRAPWGEYRTDLAGGVIASTVANMAGRMSNKPNAVPGDYMPVMRDKQGANKGTGNSTAHGRSDPMEFIKSQKRLRR